MEQYNLNVDKQELMTYFRQGVVSETKVLPSMSQVRNANELTLQDRKHDLLNFVSRPIDVYKGVWTTGQSTNTELIPSGLLFPDLLYKNPQYQEKMRGFVGLRGKICVRLIINAQKFQQGVLMAYWIPNYKNLKGKAALIQASLAGKSGCANIKINCEGGTQQTIEIPYVNQHTFYNSITDQGNYGALFLVVFGKLNSTNSTDVGVKVQTWLKDPELEYPTAVMPVITQGIEEENMHSNTADVPISGALMTKHDLLDNLSSLELKPSYMVKTAANILQAAGYQKPTNIAGVTRASLRTNNYMANSGGEHMAHKMALFANNELMPMPEAGGSYEDEMKIQNICKAPTYYKTFSVSTTNAENFVLFTDNVHPAKFVQVGTSGVMNSTFVGYTSAAFGLWRGSMKYTFICAKTGFHSGTLRVTYVPGLYSPFPNPNAVPSNINLDRCYQETYDLRDLTEFSFTAPYVSTREYLNVINEFSVNQQTVKPYNYSTGCIIVDVFVPVRAPEAVVQQFDIMVLVAAGDDIDLQMPTAPNIYPYTETRATAERVWHVNTQGISMDERHDREEAIKTSDDLIGSAKPKMDMLSAALCVGESVSSIKSLLGRFGTYYTAPATVTANTVYDIAPFDFQTPRTASTFNTAFTFDYIDYFSYLYGFYRGGMRISIDAGSAGSYSALTYIVKMRTSLGSFYPTGEIPRVSTRVLSAVPKQLLYSPFATQVIKPSLEGLIDVEVPYYSASHVAPVLVQEQTQDLVEESNYPFPLITFYTSGAATAITGNIANIQPTIYRACSDDFRFQYLLGPPQVHFIPYEDVPGSSSFQIFNVIYNNEPVTRVGNSANGLFGSAYTFGVNPSGTLFYLPNQMLAVSTDNSEIYALPENTYTIAWSTSGSRLEVLLAPYSIPTGGLYVFSNRTINANNTITELWSKYTIVSPNAGTLQSVPDPCSKFESETVTLDTSSNPRRIIIPALSNNYIVSGTDFTLNVPVLLTIGTNSASDNVPLIIVNKGTLVRLIIELAPNGNYSIALHNASTGTRIGAFVISLASNTGFTTNSFSPTAVTETPVA